MGKRENNGVIVLWQSTRGDFMNWHHFQTYNEAATRAFEAMCNQLFELWIDREYKDTKKSFVVVNGAGGDGGVESYATLVTGEEIGVQAKWFPDSITT